MTQPMMDLQEPVKREGERATCSSAAPSGAADHLREMIGFDTERLMGF